MIKTPVVCPICAASDKTFKVSTIYIEALEGFKKGSELKILAQIVDDQNLLSATGILKTQTLRSVVSSFGPPSGGKQIIRPVSPNLVMMAFSLIAIFFLIQIYTTQREMFIPILILVAIVYLGYAIFYKQIYAKYTRQIQSNINIKTSYEAAIGKWMRLYYCARDDGVFDPVENQMVPLQSMETYLLGGKIT